MTSPDRSLALEAAEIVSKDRQHAYGSPAENLGRIASLWGTFLGVTVRPEDVAMMMVLVKISRSRERYSRDNSLDGIGYLLIYDELAKEDHG